jgi:hypothetical protein
MTTTTKPLAPESTPLARREDDPPVWNRTRITFISTCPKCGHDRFQHGYTRRILFDLLKAGSKIDAYCIDCNVCWPISERERRAISPRLNARLQICNGARLAWCSQRRRPREPNWRDRRAPPSKSQMSLRQALRTLRAIRLRYEIDRRNADARLRSVLVALSCADMLWISAAIEALQEAIAPGATETGVPPATAPQET